MSTDARTQADPGIATLVTGIINDAQHLIKQQFALFRLEIKGELRQARTAALMLATGTLVVAGGAILLVLMLIHLLDSYTAIPLWGCYGITAVVLAGASALLIYLAIKQIGNMHPGLPQTTEAIKENIP